MVNEKGNRRRNQSEDPSRKERARKAEVAKPGIRLSREEKPGYEEGKLGGKKRNERKGI